MSPVSREQREESWAALNRLVVWIAELTRQKAELHKQIHKLIENKGKRAEIPTVSFWGYIRAFFAKTRVVR